MEYREYALSLLTSESLCEKLAPLPSNLTDEVPGPALFIETPGRPPELQMMHQDQVIEKVKLKFPKPTQMGSVARRAEALHFFANHELMAVELLAWALLAFPDAPSEYRKGTLLVLKDEQRHFILYRDRMRELGLKFGELPVNGYFWRHLLNVKNASEFLALLSLTFESANLDFALEYRDAFRRFGDAKSADVMEVVYRDELRHVQHGIQWMNFWKEESQTLWEAYTKALNFPISPKRAFGRSYNRDSRKKAGFDSEFIKNLEEVREDTL